MKRFTFTDPRKLAVLPDGRVRIFFDEKVEKETVITVDEDGKEHKDIHDVYTYRAAEIPAGTPVDKGTITNAIIRADYSQADVEAIFRHKHAGDKGEKADEFEAFNKAAEDAKSRAEEILK